MPREYGQIRHDIWSDDDWRSLTREAQHLYMLLLSDPKLDYCGVTAWHPGKIAQRSAETTGADTLIAGAELANRYFVVIDEETEEVLIRSYLKHDPIMKNPRLAVTMTKDFASVGSKKLRAAIVHELTRLKRANPDWDCWNNPHVKTVLRQTGASAKDMDTDLPIGSARYLGNAYPSGLPSSYPTGQPSENGEGAQGFTQALQQEQEQERATGTRTTDLAASTSTSHTHAPALRAVGYTS